MVNKTAKHSLIIIMQALQVSLSVNLKVVAPSYFFVRKLKMRMFYVFAFCGFLSSFWICFLYVLAQGFWKNPGGLLLSSI